MTATADRPSTDETVTFAVLPTSPTGPRHSRWRSGTPNWQIIGAVLLGFAVLLPYRQVWAVQAILVCGLLVVPGILLLRALRITASVSAANPALIPALSVVVLMATGALVNGVGLAAGIAAPLSVVPLAAGLVVVCGALVCCGWSTRRQVLPPKQRYLTDLRSLWPFALPLLAAAGAIELNNGGPPIFAWIAVLSTVASLVRLLLRADRMRGPDVLVGIYCCALALLWAVSLRGDFVFGWDVITEFLKAQEAVTDQYWYARRPGDAYGALLSITVLPAQLHVLAGVPVVTVFKLVFPALFAFFPVAVYSMARRFVSARGSIAVVVILLAQRNLAQQMPGLARQEIALLLFVVLLGVLLRREFLRYQQVYLVVALGAGIVVAHYSTTYLAIGLLATALLVAIAMWRSSRLGRRPLAALTLSVVVLVGGSAVWYGLVTQSTSNITETSAKLSTDGLSFLPNFRPGTGLLQTFLYGNAPQPVPAVEYAQLALDQMRAEEPYAVPLPEGGDPRYALTDVPPLSTPSRVNNLVGLFSTLLQQLVYLAGAIGAFLLMARRGGRSSVSDGLLAAMALAGVLGLALLRVSGTLAAAYNQDRALLQVLVPLAVAAIWAVERFVARRPRLVRPVLVAMTAALLVFLGNGFQLVATVTGAERPVQLAAGGEDAERFLVDDGDFASSSWLGIHASRDELVYADRYAALRYLLATGRYLNVVQNVTPATIDRDAWVLGTTANVAGGRARAQADMKTVVYGFPLPFLQDNFDQVYSNGTSSIFRR